MAGFIMALTGNEGDGKSAVMAGLARLHLNAATKHFNYPNIEAMIDAPEFKNNSPVYCFDGFAIHSPKDEKKLYSTTINPVKWFADFNNEKYRNHVYLVDEAQQWFDSRESGSVMNGLIAHAAAQRRRANISLLLTVQNIAWAYGRLRWNCHFIARCRDLSRTPWGRHKHLQRGEVISLQVWDMKGFATGYAGMPLPLVKFQGRKIWNWYDSYAPTSLKQTKVRQVKEEYVLDWNKPVDPTMDTDSIDRTLRNNMAEDDYASNYIDYDRDVPTTSPDSLMSILAAPPDMNSNMRERMRWERMKRNAGA